MCEIDNYLIMKEKQRKKSYGKKCSSKISHVNLELIREKDYNVIISLKLLKNHCPRTVPQWEQGPILHAKHIYAKKQSFLLK